MFIVGHMLLIMLSIFQLFAASFPLAPLMAILLNLIDIRIDAKRMLWSNRRPIAYIRQDIGLSLNLIIISYILNLSWPVVKWNWYIEFLLCIKGN